ncbi:hypothetical protein Plec18167_008041 [Paecilomyces lecythidis]|uniref:Xaa-Pro dipeptidyl-peptidase C-terminal domain-containing protein n=1 Tax=Paecilomyces lecythidis TaxID=3004212 RepID=A0ABR3X015_9EURO
MRDGVKLRADIYRPKTDDKVPAIIMWGPYGKSGNGILNLHLFPLRAGIPQSKLSGYENFEGLDPAEWVPKGYAVINIDPRGINDSEGDFYWWGTQDGRDGHDAVEEIAKLPWCTGKVSMAGNSWLGMSQWYIAAETPPHLTCIAPLEGAGDVIREDLCRGGILNLGFMSTIQNTLRGRNNQEDVAATIQQSQTTNEYWEDKRAKLDKIEVPAYILGSYSTGLHTLGAIRAYEEIKHERKWLTIHDTQEWYDLYSEQRIQDLEKFFARYLKGENNGWEETPSVRVSFLGFNIPSVPYKGFPDLPWRLPNTRSRRLYLTAENKLSVTKPNSASSIVYQADAPSRLTGENDNELHFFFRFSEQTILTGPSRVVIHISAPHNDDLDVYAQIGKADEDGNLLQNNNIPLSALGVSTSSEIPPIKPLKYLGPQGIIRASRRDVSEKLSTPYWKTLSNAKIEPVPPGKAIQLENYIWPTGIIFQPGEQLVLKISGHDMTLAELEVLVDSFKNGNKGTHELHVGGHFDSYLDVYTL